jgi:drug/metabolite transporter (DMT)-like permease
MKTTNKNLLGVGSLVLAILIFSLQDIAVKWMGGSYPVLEIVIFRTVIAMPATLFFFRMEGGKGLPTTKRYKLEFVRGLFYFISSPIPPTSWGWRLCHWRKSPQSSFRHP